MSAYNTSSVSLENLRQTPIVPLRMIYNIDKMGIYLDVQGTALCIISDDLYNHVRKLLQKCMFAKINKFISIPGHVIKLIVIVSVKAHQTYQL